MERVQPEILIRSLLIRIDCSACLDDLDVTPCAPVHFGRATGGSFYDVMREWFVCACWLSPSSASLTVPALRSGPCGRARLVATA